MLTSAQVIPLLSHEDPDIRRAARRYLTSAHDPAPATAEDFWAAADKEPPEESGPYLDRLGLVPQTEASLRRLLEELPKADPATRDSLRRTLERIEFDLLKQQWETIRTSEAIEDKVRAHLQARLDLASEPADPLWDRMMSFVNSIGDRDLTEAEELQADQLIEAVSRHPNIFRDRVLAAISDPNINGWPEMFVVDIAGEMKLAEATPALLEKLKSDKFDFLWELAGDALVHIGSEDVVRQIAERFPTEEIGFQISASDILGRIKRPESQKVLLDLLQGGDDPEIATSLTLAIVEQFPDDPATFEVLRKIAREESYDRSILHLDEDLLMLSKINGLELPEAEEWRKTIQRNRAQWAMGTSNFDQVFQSPGGLGPATFNAAPMRPFRSGPGIRGAATAEQAPPRQRIKPFKKATPKVGRNDPCPCGSGKKFKKCCGK